jgi:ABC-type molybdate transport system ATPase subunit
MAYSHSLRADVACQAAQEGVARLACGLLQRRSGLAGQCSYVGLLRGAGQSPSLGNFSHERCICVCVGPAQAMVQVRCGQALVLARVTHRAMQHLSLAVGSSVWCQIKSVALAD